jgi:Bacterial SH3 domain
MSIAHSDVISPKFGIIPRVLLKATENQAAPPLIPTDAPNAIERFWEENQPEEIAPPLTFEQHRSAGSAEGSIDLTERSSGRRPKLIVGTAIVIGAIGGISYFLFPSEKSPPPRQETAVISRSEPSGPTPSITSVPAQDTPSSSATPQLSSPVESAFTPPPGPVWPQPSAQVPLASWPDSPSPVVQDPPRPSAVGPRDRTALARPTTDGAAVRQPALGTESPQVVFSQRPGVNVRSTPSLTGSVVGSAAKGTRFEVLENSGEWVQVKSSSLKGWINARFIGPSAP